MLKLSPRCKRGQELWRDLLFWDVDKTINPFPRHLSSYQRHTIFVLSSYLLRTFFG